MKRLLFMLFCMVCMAGLASAQSGIGKKKPKPSDYGKVVINNFSSKAGLAPVEFDHWVHRSRFTCRLCHLDIGFAMKGGETGIKADDNMRGHFCGACHNGRMVVEGRKLFASCSGEVPRSDTKRCERCHVATPSAQKEAEFLRFADRLPKVRGGNGIDWELAGDQKLIRPVDRLEGIPMKRAQVATQKGFDLYSKLEGMPDIIFSHRRHAEWNGCDLCHPKMFTEGKRDTTRYSMTELFDGRYCGSCHLTVAFPLDNCKRCHPDLKGGI